MLERYLTPQVKKDLEKKMVFIGGARQVGKTTLAESIIDERSGAYLNWDIPKDREIILKRELPVNKLLVLDEVHKYKRWRNYLKGLYDERKRTQQILVTGSARLDYYRFGGDSLQGRYHYLRLHPLSIAELKLDNNSELQDLLKLSGFPEPFFGGSEIEAKRWSSEYRSRLLSEELNTLEKIHDVGQLELMMIRLPELVGSPLSINRLKEDLNTSHATISRWLKILERLYAIFRLSPFGSDKIRAVKKEQKHYHFDWSLVQNPSFRFENLVASHLLKWVNFEQDTKGRDLELRYFRHIDGREIDFVLVDNNKPIQCIECKWEDAPINPMLNYFKNKFPNCEAYQISAVGKKDSLSKEKIRVMQANSFLSQLI